MERMEEHNAEIGDGQACDAEVTEINGKMYLVHTVEPQDSITRLSLQYNVDAKQIKLANGLPNDMIHHKEKLNIPMTNNFKYTAKAPMTKERALEEEKSRRAQAVSMMNQYLAEVNRCPGRDFKAEAIFYCEENNYEYRKAKQAYDEDRKFEEE